MRAPGAFRLGKTTFSLCGALAICGIGVGRNGPAESIPPVYAFTPNTEHLSNGCVYRELASSKVAELAQIWLDFKTAWAKIPRRPEAVPIRCADRIGPAVGVINCLLAVAPPRQNPAYGAKHPPRTSPTPHFCRFMGRLVAPFHSILA